MLTVSLLLLTAIQPTLQPRDAPGTKPTHAPLWLSITAIKYWQENTNAENQQKYNLT